MRPQRSWYRARLVTRFALVILFVLLAALTPTAVGMPRPPLTWMTAGISMGICLAIALAIWWSTFEQ